MIPTKFGYFTPSYIWWIGIFLAVIIAWGIIREMKNKK